MFYIHHTSCISPQQTFPSTDLQMLHQPQDNKLKVIEPTYGDIPTGVLRRMSKAVRIGMGAGIAILKKTPAPDGIIIGTANAGFEDCFHFLKQIVEFDEGLLSPGSFVQSTPNALAAQLGMLSQNKSYNITHVHLGHAFENAMTDVAMLIREHPGNNYLLGAVDDISSHNYTLNLLGGWFKEEIPDANLLYDLDSPGSIAGEGAAMFWVNGDPTNATARVQAIDTLHSGEMAAVNERLINFLAMHLQAGEKIGLMISGENGDNLSLKYYLSCEEIIGEQVPVLRFKHMSGEYPTASAMALWLACYVLQQNPVPLHMIKKSFPETGCKNILVYNNYKGVQHSFILIRR